MFKQLITIISIICFGSQPLQAQLTANELKAKINEALRDAKTTYFQYKTSSTHTDYERDAQSNTHLYYSFYDSTRHQYALIKTAKGVFSRNKNEQWVLTSQKETDYEAWIDASKEAFRVLEKPIKTCFLKRETAIKGVPHSVYVVQTDNDSLNIFLDKTSNKVTRFDGQNDTLYTAYSAYFDMPFEVGEPEIPYEKDRYLGISPFAPIFTDFEDYDSLEPVFVVAETSPEFEGGSPALFRFMGESWHFPKASLEEGLRGTVYIGFVVEKDGRLTNFKVKRRINAECDAESLRVAKLMSGKWKAGMIKGKKVRVAYTQQFKFRAGCG